MFSLTWLPQVLRDAGLEVVETPGWQTCGHGDFGKPAGVLCHHTCGSDHNIDLDVLEHGRPDLQGPVCNLGLGRDGEWFIVAAGKAWHAGRGLWQGVSDGNSRLIGVEAQNHGTPSDPWPDAQMDAYKRGVAAILKHIGANAIMAVGHKEYALPHGRKDDPSFDMVKFRADVAALMGAAAEVATAAATPPPETPDLPRTLGFGDRGADVSKLQETLNAAGYAVAVDGAFGDATRKALLRFQATRGLTADGTCGPKTWAALVAGRSSA